MEIRQNLGWNKRQVLKELARIAEKKQRFDDLGYDGKRIVRSERREVLASWFELKIEEKYRELMAQNAFRALFGGEVEETPTIWLPDNVRELQKIYDYLDKRVFHVFGGCEI